MRLGMRHSMDWERDQVDLRDVVCLLSPLGEHAHHSNLLVNKMCLVPHGPLIT